MTIAHDLNCGTCGAPATHEQCGGALACDEHIMSEGRAWLIDAKTIELHGGAAITERLRDVLTRTIDGLTVRGVGIGDGVLYVYCRAKRNAQQRIPKEFEGHAVKYVLCKAMPGGAR